MPRTALSAGYRFAAPSLRESRVAAGLTQNDLAALADCDSSLLAKIERSKTRAKPAVQAAIAEALERDVVELFPPPAPRTWFTEAELALEAGCSVMTVNNALNGRAGGGPTLAGTQNGAGDWETEHEEANRWIKARAEWRAGMAAVTLTCARDGCEVEFERWPSQFAKNGADYCSTCANPSDRVSMACFVCGGEIERVRSAATRATNEHRRVFCGECWPLFRDALCRAREVALAVARGDGKAADRVAAWDQALAIGEALKNATEVRWKEMHPRGGHPSVLDVDIAIEAMFVSAGLTDVEIRGLIGHVGFEYVKTRRKLSKIRRRAAA